MPHTEGIVHGLAVVGAVVAAAVGVEIALIVVEVVAVHTLGITAG